MLASTQVSFLVIVCCLRKNNDLRLMVLMYSELMVPLILFSHDFCESEGHFELVLCVLLLLQETNSGVDI